MPVAHEVPSASEFAVAPIGLNNYLDGVAESVPFEPLFVQRAPFLRLLS